MHSYCSDVPVAVAVAVVPYLGTLRNRTGTSVDNGARSKNTRKELGQLRRRVLTELYVI